MQKFTVQRGIAALKQFLSAFAPLRETVFLVLASLVAGNVAAAEKLEFNRDIRPILSETCFHCHGPDKAKREADLRLDVREEALKDLGGHRAIVPGKAESSELVKRITSSDPDLRMPPAKSERKLTEQQIATLKRWVAEGAEYQSHWSLIAPQRPPVPQVKNADGIKNPIDAFIRARLEREGLGPATPADPATLIRRVTLDLTGLPPTVEEVDAFARETVERTGEKAYLALVDRLLSSPRYGERMAGPWLDAARYADTNGYQTDGPRFMWRWRDWVINAFNRNLPFDQFTIEQLAGDLLPNPTLDQVIATGFNRNHRGNAEGGIIPAEFLVEYVADRVETTSTVWLGMTIGCARCHDHKYDPITQKEFYQLFAYFNNVPELGKVLRETNSPPVVKSPTPEMQRRLEELDRELANAEAKWKQLEPQVATAQSAWEKTLLSAGSQDESLTAGLMAHFSFDGNANNSAGKSATGKATGGEPAYVSGPLGAAAQFNGKQFIDVGDVADLSENEPFSFSAWVFPRTTRPMAVLSRMDEDMAYLGYDLYFDGGKFQVDLCGRILDDAIRVETAERFAPGRWYHVLVTYDASKFAAGVQVYVDGRPAKMNVLLDLLSNPIRAKEPLRIGSRGTSDLFEGAIDEVRFYDYKLSADEITALANSEPLAKLAAIPASERTTAQATKLRVYFLHLHAPPAIQQAQDALATARKTRQEFVDTIPTTMVMQELPQPRDTHLLVRGEYDKRGEKVTAGVPACMPALPGGGPNNRLALARWLTDPSHPLTARVAVNRFWQMYFGTGLVKTAEDFGSQGEWPIHPELLDWLATEFIRSGWDIKALQKLIVTSATYRQSSQATPALIARDPENRLLARGPRFRLPAEMVRDQALAASGLLVEKIGGPSVKPYQPEGLWEELATGTVIYKQDHGESLYRRSLYTFWKRTIAPPSMMTFDASSRETCVVRQSKTNTPLQALNLMNDVAQVEAARNLAQLAIKAGSSSADARVTNAFRRVLAREPKPSELKVLTGGYERYLARYREDSVAAEKLISFGESPHDKSLNSAELAAMTAVCNVILNLDETITRE
jgi:hypothetical protein